MNASAVAWIVSIGFILMLGVGFLVGMWRGWKRSTFNLVCSVVGMVGGIFLTKPITNAIMGIKISSGGTQTTLNGLLVNELQKNNDINLMMNANANFKQFINGLPSAIANAIVFMLVSMAISFVIYLIYRIACIGVKYKEGEKKKRLIGGVLGGVKVFILGILALMPLVSLTRLVGDMATRESYIVETSTSVEEGIAPASLTLASEGKSTKQANKYGYIGEIVPDAGIELINGFNNSLIGKICGIGNLDDSMFDFLAQVEVDKAKVNVREEISSYYEVLAFKYDVEHATNLNFTNINYAKLSKAVNKVVESPLFTKVISQSLADMMINYEDYSFLAGLKTEYGNILDKIGQSLQGYEDKSQYFSNDLNKLVDIFAVLGKNGIIDDINKLDVKNIDNILQTLTNDDAKEGEVSNKQGFDNALKNVFSMNMIRDSISQILQKYSAKLIDGLDEVGVDTSAWQEEDWTNTANQISSLITNYANLSKEVDFAQVLTDATILLDKTQNYNISNIMTNLGAFIDNALNINLLKTSSGKSIFSSLLANNNITLPSESEIIKNWKGQTVDIQSYTQLFDFISPSLLQLRESGLYEVIANGQTSIKEIANIISQKNEGGEYVNKTLLQQIILPLNQVQPTKSLIMDNLKSSFGGGIVNLDELVTFEEWNKDLGYISDLLIILNSTHMPDGITTYLDSVLNDKTNEMFDNLSMSQVENIIKPILYAKSTTSLKNQIMTNIANECNDLTGANDSIDLTNVTLVQGDKEDQGEEICEIIKALISLRGESGKLEDMNEDKVKTILSTLQANGYRTVQDATLSSQGAFKGIFNSIMAKFKGELSQYDEACNLKYSKTTIQKLEEMCGNGYLQEENYGRIDFQILFTNINNLKAQIQ